MAFKQLAMKAVMSESPGSQEQSTDHHHPTGGDHHPSSPPYLCWCLAKLFPVAGERRFQSGALLLPPHPWYRPRERTSGTKRIKELDGLGNLGQVTLPPHDSTSLLTPQKFLKAGIFSIAVCAAPTPTGCALLLVIVVSTAISFKGHRISITVESKERACRRHFSGILFLGWVPLG